MEIVDLRAGVAPGSDRSHDAERILRCRVLERGRELFADTDLLGEGMRSM